jgi:hypothetical protein
MLTVIDPAEMEPVVVGPGCFRRDLPNVAGLRIWIVEMAPGAEWPYVDEHDAYGEQVLVVEGEMIEGDRRIGPGSFLSFGAFSSHQPRTETGVRLFGVNATGSAPNEAA